MYCCNIQQGDNAEKLARQSKAQRSMNACKSRLEKEQKQQENMKQSVLVHFHSCHQESFRGRMRGNGFPIVKVILECIMDVNANHFPSKMHHIAGFCVHNLKIFPGVTPRIPTEAPPGGLTHTSISAWLASVPIVSILPK